MSLRLFQVGFRIEPTWMCYTVPALYNPWWLNFLLHWSFYLELAVIVLALCLWYRTSGSTCWTKEDEKKDS
jgi:hypothetical protein